MFRSKVSAGEQLLEALESHEAGDGKSDGRPKGVTAADPVPEDEHVVGVDAEFPDLGGVGGDRHEMPCHVGVVSGMRQEPLPRAEGVGHGLLRGEGLGGDQEQGGFGVERFEGLGDVGAVHVGDEVHPQPGRRIGPQAFGDHHRAEVRAADADVDEVPDRSAGVPRPGARANLLREILHPRQHGLDLGHDIPAVRLDPGVRTVAQGHVEHGAVFGFVDPVAGEHALDRFPQAAALRQLDQQAEGFRGDAVLGVVHEDVLEADGELLKALRVLRKEPLHVNRLQARMVDRKFFPGRGGGGVDFGQHPFSFEWISGQ
jgi:hypothetical protein